MIYVIGQKGKRWKSLPVKIGYSSNPNKRLREIQTGNPHPLCIRKILEGTTKEEVAIHKLLRKSKTVGEWFLFNRYTVNALDVILGSSPQINMPALSLAIQMAADLRRDCYRQRNSKRRANEYTLNQEDREAISMVYRRISSDSGIVDTCPVRRNPALMGGQSQAHPQRKRKIETPGQLSLFDVA